MRLSIVIPTYNAGTMLREAISSIDAGQRTDVEIIVVDDGSDDDSIDTVLDIPQVRVERRTNRGPGSARNRGIELARSDWVAFLDADDAWRPGRLQGLLDHAAKTSTALVFTSYLLERPDGAETQHIDCPAPPDPAAPNLLLFNPISTSTVMARREKLLAVGGFHPVLRFAEDWDLWLRLAEIGGIEVQPGTWVKRRERHDSLSAANVSYLYECRCHVLDRALARRPDLYGAVIRRAHANVDLRAGIEYYRAGLFAEAREALGRSLRRGRWRPTWKYLLRSYRRSAHNAVGGIWRRQPDSNR